MALVETVGIIGGNGWLGGAIAKSCIEKAVIDLTRLGLSGRSTPSPIPELSAAFWTHDNQALVTRSDVIILSVRPEQLDAVNIDASDKLLVSVMASVTVDHLQRHTGARRVVRSIPNAAAAIGQSFTPWYASPDVTAADKHIVQQIFRACGRSAEVEKEAHVDYCSVMTGTGAAFPALLAEALRKHALANGLPQDLATTAAHSVVAEASRLFVDGAPSAREIVQTMIAYKGLTTIALEAMLEHGFDAAVDAGLTAALEASA